MSWQKLKEKIQSISPGVFEDLIAKLLSSFLNQPFVVARKGDQPSGDARSLAGDVSMQAKRYTGKKSPNAKYVEGDIRQAIRTLPYIQVYVLALSCGKAQLHDTLDPVAEETGLDIVILELTDEISDIGALCVWFWEDISHCFDQLNSDEEFLVWVEKMKNDSETKRKLEEVKRKLDSGIQTQYHVKNDVEEYLSERFSRNEGYNPINLSQAIERQETEFLINDWWNSDNVPVCFLQGEEGTGKTWLAAKWMNSIHESEDIVTFWLDSKDWNGCKSIHDLLMNCFSLIYPSFMETKIKKFQMKAAKIWHKTLIVLDGVNERNAIETAESILLEYFRHRSEWKDRICFLFTTRPLDKYPNSESYLWKKCNKILVTPFSDSEFQLALTQIRLQNSFLPDSIREIARIPRYFNTCIRLRNQFGSIGTVTKELVLWVGLLEKIERTDPQIKQKLGWHRAKDAQEILSNLAKQAKWTSVDLEPQISVQQIQKSIPNYREVRQDLEEQRIVVDAGLQNVKLSRNHIVLGYALLLSSHYDSKDFSDIQEYVIDLFTILEPIPSEDLRTEAMFVALDIASSPSKLDIFDIELSRKRSFFMYAWFNSNNADITDDRIFHCVENYTDAYAKFVEFEFKKDILPNKEEALIEPLAITWKNRKGQLNHLESRLKKWLHPTYTDEYVGSNEISDSDSSPKPNLHFTQNRLAKASLSILSQRTEHQFLRALAQCYAIHVKIPQYYMIYQDIGRLMRWGFTEDVIDKLRSLAARSQTDETLLKGLYGLSEELKLTNLPKPLVRPLSQEDKDRKESVENWNNTFRPFIHRIKDREQLLKHDSPDANAKGNYHGLAHLAVRTDLPDLLDNDMVKIKKLLYYISVNTEWGKSAAATLEDYCVENLIPWFAKNNPQNYLEFARNFTINFLNLDYQAFMSCYLEGIIFCKNDSKRISDAILGMKEQLTQAEEYHSDIVWLIHLTELLLFSESEKILIDWFSFLASQESLRSSICYETLPYLFENLLPVSILELAVQKLEEFKSSTENQKQSDKITDEFSEEEFWCSLFAYGSKIENKTVNYALEDLKMREPDAIGTFPMLYLAYSDPKLFLDEIPINENIQQHLYSKNGRRWKMRTYDGNDVPSYELLRSYLPTEIIGSFLCAPERRADLSRWGKDLMEYMLSILHGAEGDSNTVEGVLFGINRRALQTWAERNQTDFLHLSGKYLRVLSKAPFYQQILSDFTDSIQFLLLRFQPETAMNFYRQWSNENFRTKYNEFGIETLLAQLWKVEECTSPEHVELRRFILEDYQNDEKTMFMTIAALFGGGKQELWDLVTQEYLMSSYAKERNLGVSILPWFGNDDAIEILENLKINDPSLWVRRHAEWAYEVAQQERSCRTVYKEALETRDLFRISAAFEQIKPALSPTAKCWHLQIEEELGLNTASQHTEPKLISLVYRFWYRWGKSPNTRRDIKIYGRKLSEYCRGEKLGSGSPPRLSPWWIPEGE